MSLGERARQGSKDERSEARDESTRPWSLKISYAKIASAAAYAIYSLGKVEPVLLLLLAIVFLGVLALHVMVNWLNDYFDYFKGTDTETSGSVSTGCTP